MMKNKSKYFVIGFVLFVAAIYTGSYFYTRSHNEYLLAAPRLVGFGGDVYALNERIQSLSPVVRVAETQAMIRRGEITVISQAEYQEGGEIKDSMTVVDCMELAETLKRTKRKAKLLELSASWGYAACVPEE